MENFRLYKHEKLRSRTAINTLFAGGGHSVIAYPLRAVYRLTDGDGGAQFLITIPKKKIRTAVGRVLLRVREAYRLNRQLIIPTINSHNKHLEVAFVWLSSEPAPYAVIEARVQEILNKIASQVQ